MDRPATQSKESTPTPASHISALAVSDADRDAALRAANRPSSGFRLGWLWEWAKVFPAAVLLFLILRTLVVEAYKIPSGSMERTLLVGDFLLVNKMVYGAELPFSNKRLPGVRAPNHGDVIVFQYPVDPSKNFVKRLVGLPGDTVSMASGKLSLNGVPQREDYVVRSDIEYDRPDDAFRWQQSHLVKTATAAVPADSAYHPSRDNWGPIVVPPHAYFVLGDNRDNSEDSRYWGFVPDSLLRGTPLLVYFSYVPDSMAKAPWLTHVRWGRLGTIVR